MPRAHRYSHWIGIDSGWHKDPATGVNTFVARQNVDDILRLTHHSRNHERAHNALGDPLVASVPIVEYYRALAEDGIDARKWFHMPRREKRKWERSKLRPGGDWDRFRASDKVR